MEGGERKQFQIWYNFKKNTIQPLTLMSMSVEKDSFLSLLKAILALAGVFSHGCMFYKMAFIQGTQDMKAGDNCAIRILQVIKRQDLLKPQICTL